jgi:hypothetical protein
MAEYLNLLGKERGAYFFNATYGRLYGEGVYVLATSNFKLPHRKSRNGDDPLTLHEAYKSIVRPVRFAEAEARAKEARLYKSIKKSLDFSARL